MGELSLRERKRRLRNSPFRPTSGNAGTPLIIQHGDSDDYRFFKREDSYHTTAYDFLTAPPDYASGHHDFDHLTEADEPSGECQIDVFAAAKRCNHFLHQMQILKQAECSRVPRTRNTKRGIHKRNANIAAYRYGQRRPKPYFSTVRTERLCLSVGI